MSARVIPFTVSSPRLNPKVMEAVAILRQLPAPEREIMTTFLLVTLKRLRERLRENKKPPQPVISIAGDPSRTGA